jgi:hypothetical protein
LISTQAGTGLGEGSLLRSVGVTGASSADSPYVDTAACVEPCVVLEVLGGVEINQRAKGDTLMAWISTQ